METIAMAFGELNRKFGNNGIALLPNFVSDYRHVTDVALQGQDIIVSALSISGITDEHYFALARFSSRGVPDFGFGKPSSLPSSSILHQEETQGHAFGKFEENIFHSSSEAVAVSDNSIWVLGWLAEEQFSRRLPVLAELDRDAASLRNVQRLSLPEGSSIRSSEGRTERPIFSRLLVDQNHLVAAVNFERFIERSPSVARRQKTRRHYPPRLYRLTLDGRPGFGDSRDQIEIEHPAGPVTITGLAASTQGLLVSGYVTKGVSQSAFIARYLTDGTLDKKFGVSGFVTFQIEHFKTRIRHMPLLPNGKILVAGALREIDEYPDAGWIQQYLQNGAADPGFNEGKAVIDNLTDEAGNPFGVEWKTVTADNDGIIAWGRSEYGDFCARRYGLDGTQLPLTYLEVPWTENALLSIQRDQDIIIATNTFTDKGFAGSLSSFRKA
ncbi:hypothetical protein HU751_014155 [Pseudomonas sp. BW13M1]|uniref:Uncharacterized protein n=1 Tax=Pseudomonas peradeniyensis TaxID=2745488 RepID=A0A923G5W8_9PSED|nr:hypothetical protein [Pseudomonas peradeniyensis]MBV4505990.1 hypothetical protein [Pseudomonas peradeniyensis]